MKLGPGTESGRPSCGVLRESRRSLIPSGALFRAAVPAAIFALLFIAMDFGMAGSRARDRALDEAASAAGEAYRVVERSLERFDRERGFASNSEAVASPLVPRRPSLAAPFDDLIQEAFAPVSSIPRLQAAFLADSGGHIRAASSWRHLGKLWREPFPGARRAVERSGAFSVEAFVEGPSAWSCLSREPLSRSGTAPWTACASIDAEALRAVEFAAAFSRLRVEALLFLLVCAATYFANGFFDRRRARRAALSAGIDPALVWGASSSWSEDPVHALARRLGGELDRANMGAQALEDAKSRLQTIFDSDDRLVGLLSPDGILLEANRTAEAFSGIPESLAGRRFADTPWWTAHPPSRQRLIAAIPAAAAGETVRFVALQPDPSGALREIDFVLRPLADADGVVGTLLAEGFDRESAAQAERSWSALADSAPVGIFRLDASGKLNFSSKKWRDICSITEEAAEGFGWLDLFAPPDRLALEAAFSDPAGAPLSFEAEILLSGGGSAPTLWSISPLRRDAGSTFGFAGVCMGLSEVAAAKASASIAENILMGSREAILVCDDGGSILMANPSFERLSGYAPAEYLGTLPSALVSSGLQTQDFYRDMWTQITESGHWSGELWNRNKSGGLYCVVGTISKLSDDVFNRVGARYVGSFSDITDFKNAQNSIESIANSDSVTGLRNRQGFASVANAHFSVCLENRKLAGMLLADIDGFRQANDIHGPEFGDAILREAAARLSAAFGDDRVGRIGDDDFAVLVSADEHREIRSCADRALAALTFSMPIPGDGKFSCSARVGAAMVPVDGGSFAEIFQAADLALRKLRDGSDRIGFHDPALSARILEERRLEERLRDALASDEISCAIQPKWSSADFSPSGSEILARWSMDGQPVSPGRFVPIIEGAGLASELGRTMIRKAFSCARRFSLEAPGLLPLSVNVSALHLKTGSVADDLRQALSEIPVDPAWIELEITESAWVDFSGAVDATLAECSSMGFSMSIDDFGTGYSNLGRLKSLPAKTIKIDQSFVRECAHSKEDAAIVAGVCSMAISLGLDLVAEGVETLDQLQVLRASGCRKSQGYLRAKPLPVDDAVAWTAEQPPRPMPEADV